MTLTAGTRIGPYEIIGPIGAGGMGEVYRARDTKLHREVAIKVLPELFAADPDRLARFEREAQSLAALNHPNIAQVFGVLETPAALAMELVEGEDLSQRLARGPIPIEEALPIARQIADALEAAHERGIIHRDLKPANIKVRDDGTVKVLDFGLAKAAAPVAQGFSPADEGSPKALRYESQNSPTFASPAMTQFGVILGTAAYMAPEQAKGRAIDKRADIWAFGCVLFEMLTAERPFGGEDVTDTIAAIVKDEPDWRRLPANLPVSVVSLLHRCLQKDPRRRLRDIGDARIDLDDAIEGRVVVPSAPRAGVAAGFARRWWVAAALAVAALVGSAATWLVVRGRAVEGTPPPMVRFEVAPAAGVTHVPNVALAPDASFVVYAGDIQDGSSLFVHRFDSGRPQQLSGTEGARWPFISPDGKWVGFFRSGRLQKISLAGGDALTLCEAPGGPGALWLADRRIVFSGSWLAGLSVVDDDGGKPAVLTTLDASKGEKGHWWPAALPDGRLLFTVFMAGAGLNDNRVAVVDPASGRHHALFPGVKAFWLPSGHVLFNRAGRYQVMPFDLASLRATGDAAPVLEDATDLDPAGDWPQPVVVSSTGTVAYVPGQYVPMSRLVWISPDGRVTPLNLPDRPYVNIAVSPNGEEAAVGTLERGRLSLRLLDLVRGTDSALDVEGMNWHPAWHPDGKRLSFTSMRKGDFDIYMKSVATAEREVPLLTDAVDSSEPQWAPDGRLVFEGSEPDGSYRLKLIDPRSPGAVTRVSEMETSGRTAISPDGKWLAFVTSPEGRNQLYVQPFPGPGPSVQVSAVGSDPLFRPGSNELFFRRGQQLVAATWQERNGRFFVTGERIVASPTWSDSTFGGSFTVRADGRVLALILAGAPEPPRINIILGWAQGLHSQ